MCAQVISTPVPLNEQWLTALALVKRSFRSSLHYTFASVNADGTPHVSPIGSLLYREDIPSGLYFELFTRQLPHNLEQQPQVCIWLSTAANCSGCVPCRRIGWTRWLKGH